MNNNVESRTVLDFLIILFYIFFGFSLFLVALKFDGFKWANEIYFTICFLFVFYIYLKFRLVKKQKSWIPIQATILSKQLIKKECLGILMVDAFSPEIKYTYNYNNQSYISEQYAIFECNQLSSYNYAKELMDSYTKGQIVEVFIDPNKPSQSVIKKGFSLKYIYLLYGFIFYIFIILFVGVFI